MSLHAPDLHISAELGCDMQRLDSGPVSESLSDIT